MAEPWEKYQQGYRWTPEETPAPDAPGPEAKYQQGYRYGQAPAAEPPPSTGPTIASATPDQGSILPFRRTPEGPVFDPTAGVLGSLMRAITTPGDVYTGKIPIMTDPEGRYNPDLLGRATETAQMFSPTAASIRAGEHIIPGAATNLTKRAELPSAKALKEAADIGYTAVRETGPEILSSSIADRVRSIMGGEFGTRFGREDAKGTYAHLDSMLDPKMSWTSMTDLLAKRDALNEIVRTDGSANGKAAKAVVRQLDDFLENLGTTNTRPQANVPNPMAPDIVAKTLADARRNTGAAMRSNRITGELDPATTGLLEQAESESASLNRALINKSRAMLKRNAEIGGLSDEEAAALRRVRDQGPLRQGADEIGRMLGGRGPVGTIASAGVGNLLGSIIGMPYLGAVVAPTIGWMGRLTANTLARRDINAVDRLARARSPLAAEMLQQAPADVVPGLTRDAVIARTLIPGLLTPNAADYGPRTRLEYDR